MDEFCGSTFWNTSLTWETYDPDFTPCFQKTVLVWVPCLFLWIWAPLETYYILSSKTKGIPWTWKNCLKLFFTLILIILSVGDLAFTTFRSDDSIKGKVDYSSPFLKIITFALNGCFIVFNRIKGLRTSGLLFLFWLLMSVCGAVQFRSLLVHGEMFEEESQWPFISYMMQYALVLVILFINCFADDPPSYSEYLPVDKPCPEESASFLSKIFFSWFDSLAWLGFRKPLETSDLWSMNPIDSSAEVVPAFDKYWEKSLRKSINVASNEKATYRKVDTNIDITPTPASKRYQASILPALCRTFGPTFLFGALLKLFQDLLLFIQPQILKLLIDYVNLTDGQLWKGFFYSLALFFTASLQTLILAQYFNRMNLIGLRIRTALISTIYRKALRLSNTSRKISTVGEIVNLMSVDAQRFMDLMTYINMIWSAPFQIVVALYFLWDILGVSVLAGLAVMIIMIPLNGWVASRVRQLQIRQMKSKDERVKLMNEVLSGIKVLKLYAWELSFENLVLKIRDKELEVLRQTAYLYSSTTFIWSCVPFLVSLVSFACFILTDENNILDSKTAFVSLSLFNILRFPLSMLPMLISNMVQVSVSIKRINKFMNADELDPNFVTHNTDEKDPIVVENGTFSWGSGEEPILKNINIHCRQGSLVAVVGAVGSGKSSLISAFLGEMDKLTGKVNVKGSVAYVSQQAWIQNATLKDNILFGKSLDSSLYPRVIEACALKPDIEMLPAGDQTEIGEKGINLSGGQKQRVSLARAVYNDADIYYLDDPLSAVDSHVGKHIFESVIGPTGILRKKTRVLVTHSITYLNSVDHIIVLKDGKISESGTYKELLEKKGAFAEFLIQYLQNDDRDDVNSEQDLDEIKQQLESTLGSEELKKTIMRVRNQNSESESTEALSRQNSLKRQTSIESSDRNSPRKASVDKGKVKENVGEKLIEAEKAEVGKVKWNVYSHYMKSIGLFMTIFTLVFNVLFQGFSIGSNVWLSKWSNDQSADVQTRHLYLGVYGALGIGQAITTVVGAVANFIGALTASSLLHRELLRAVLGTPLSFFDVTPVGRILNRFAKDVDTVDTVLPHTIRSWTMCLFSVIATLVVISTTTPLFISVIIPVGLIYYFVQRFYVATSRQLKRIESISRSPIYSHFGETITGAPIIRAFNVSKRFIAESESKVDFNQVCYYPSIIANRWLAVRLEMVGNLIIFFSALFAVLNSGIDAGLVGLSVSYALQITQTLNWLVRMTSDVETNIVAVERIKEYRETKQEAPWEIASTAPPSYWPSKGEVEFQNYKVRYRDGLELVLKGISFKVNGGEKVGIVGRTGAGKSSLTLCLFRIIEAANGIIRIDGVDISKLGLHQLRSKLTIIPQDPVLFSGTLRLNLDPFDAHPDDELWKALEHAHLASYVRGMAAGLNHEVTEGGENLSVGQRQLICLARALLRKTKVLILDEATAAIDLETDDLIQQTIRSEFKECTVLTIAHRLNTIMDSDKVIVLDKGYIIEYDTPSSLLEKKESTFYSMAKDAGLV